MVMSGGTMAGVLDQEDGGRLAAADCGGVKSHGRHSHISGIHLVIASFIV